MKLKTNAFQNHHAISSDYAFCKIADPVTFSKNMNPDLTWSEPPVGTKSFVILLHDETVPTKPEDVNQPDREVPENLPRGDFFHWVLIDLEPSLRRIEAGDCSDGVVEKGKTKQAKYGRVGLNDYTGWFANDPEMKGKYFGYDGPCPPWNDALVHVYHLTLYALDIPTLNVNEAFTGPQITEAIKNHVLDSATLSFKYTLNKRLAQ